MEQHLVPPVLLPIVAVAVAVLRRNIVDGKLSPHTAPVPESHRRESIGFQLACALFEPARPNVLQWDH